MKHRFIFRSLQPLLQNDALERENDTKGATIIQSGDPDVGFRPEQSERGNANSNDDVLEGNDVKDAANVRHDRSRRDFHRQSRHPTQ